MPKRLKYLGVLILLPLLQVGPARAGDDPEEIIKYRQAMMKALSGHMSAAARLVRGKVSYSGHLREHADAIAALAAHVGDLFPEGSDFGETEALEAIWEQPDKFAEAAQNNADAAAALRAAAASGQGIDAAFGDLSDACKSCHKTFREKE